MIHVIATIKAKPGQRGTLLAAFKELLPQVLAEDGCVAYTPTIDARTDIARQARVGDDTLVMIESWRSVEHLKAHLAAPHMTAFRQKAVDWIDSSELRVLTAG
jgi:quinol monooxygenase YgiN